MTLRCPACGGVFDDDTRFCPRDGARLVERETTLRPGSLRRTEPQAGSPSPAADSGRSKPTPHVALIGRTLDSRYRIERKIGEGGMSFVYLAHDVHTEEMVAIKILSPALAEDRTAMARLRREAALAMRLEHPNICYIKRLGETADGLVYVVMPFIDGELLSDREYRLGVIPLADAARFVTDIAAGLQMAHALKIIHRDLKPENIMVVGPGEGTRAVVMDFGLAKDRRPGSEREKLTASGVILGTPEFMSPEQLRGKPLDGRTDVYSLSLMTFEMLTGKLPFQGRTQQEMMINRLRADPTPVRVMRPDLDFPAGVVRVLAKGMSRDAGDRYQTAPELAVAFRAAAEGREIPEETSFLGKLFGR